MPDTVRVVWDGNRPPDGDIQLEDGSEWKRDTPLPHGYHTLHDGSLIICAPRKAHPIDRKTWGVFVPLHAAHVGRSHIGDLSVLQQYLDWTRELGGDIVATLPLLASFEHEHSPYSPVSRLFWNEKFRSAAAEPPLSQSGDSVTALLKEYAAFRADKAHPAEYWIDAQLQVSAQMRALPKQSLYLDFPLGVHADGFDVHRFPNVFAKGYSVGAPPDSFFTKGQNWGFPPYDTEGIRENRYEYFRAAIAHHMKHAGLLRLDHVMGLHRLYWIPDGADATEGHYVRYREDELYAIITLESRRHRCAVVGEDLGTVPKYVPRAMKSHGLLRMFVVQYEAKPEPLPAPPENSVASINTHDMPPFASFWRGLDIDDRRELDLLDDEGAARERETRAKIREELTRQLGSSDRCGRGLQPAPGRAKARPHIFMQAELDVLEALLRFLGASEAEVVLVNLEDLWSETNPQNMPGVPERSWKQRFKLSLEEAREDATVQRLLAALNGARALLQGQREKFLGSSEFLGVPRSDTSPENTPRGTRGTEEPRNP